MNFDLDTALTARDMIAVGLGLVIAYAIIVWRRNK